MAVTAFRSTRTVRMMDHGSWRMADRMRYEIVKKDERYLVCLSAQSVSAIAPVTWSVSTVGRHFKATLKKSMGILAPNLP